jgi:hypothetical protein
MCNIDQKDSFCEKDSCFGMLRLHSEIEVPRPCIEYRGHRGFVNSDLY